MLKDVLENNFYISVGGTLTFKNAKRVVEVVERVPLDRLLIEGKRNDSSYKGHEF